MTSRVPKLALAAFTCLVFLAVPVSAAEENQLNAPLGWLFRWLNFAIVFGGVGYLLIRKAPVFFRSRAEAIVASITEAAHANAQAERRLREAEEKLRQLDREVAELRAAAQRDSAAEAERIQAVARDEAGKIERAAQAEMEAAERAARMELKALAARLAVERAEAILRERITPETQAVLFRSFLNDLARSAN